MQTEPFSLKGEVALVTGGATGIGHAIAAALTRQGAIWLPVDGDASIGF